METKLKCILVDDEVNSVSLLAAYIQDLYPGVEVTGRYYSWREALNGIRAQKPDILLLDISMPERSGIDMLGMIPDPDFEVIFITAHAEYALDAFRFYATGYLMKPLDDEGVFMAVMDKAIERILAKRYKVEPVHNSGEKPLKLGIPSGKGVDYVNIADIMYLYSYKKYTKVVTSSAVLVSSYGIGLFRELITSDLFYQVHQSYIVNISYVERYLSDGYVIMSDKREIPVARSVKKEFLNNFLMVSHRK